MRGAKFDVGAFGFTSYLRYVLAGQWTVNGDGGWLGGGGFSGGRNGRNCGM